MASETNKGAVVEGMALLVGFQLAGELVQRLAHLPIPAGVIGMFLLFLALLWRGKVPHGLHLASNGLLDNLALLFVPATVGAFFDIRSVSDELLTILVAVVASTFVAMGVSAGTMVGLEHLRRKTK